LKIIGINMNKTVGKKTEIKKTCKMFVVL
jgi:hypothetical protein